VQEAYAERDVVGEMEGRAASSPTR
jgi:hypothetical protein